MLNVGDKMSEINEKKIDKIIKSKVRVQKHGEVFTPLWTVKNMLDLPGVKEACEDINTTFLEPAVGEGAFLIEILRRKLNMVSKDYSRTLLEYENYSLLALSTLYGIELLEDNAQNCVMNMYQVFYEFYNEKLKAFDGNVNNMVLDSAKVIISANISQGNFLTRKSTNGEPLVFSEWSLVKSLNKRTKRLKINRTEYTLDDVLDGTKKEFGTAMSSFHAINNEQITMFDFLDEKYNNNEKVMRYVPVYITEVYKEEMEEVENEY